MINSYRHIRSIYSSYCSCLAWCIATGIVMNKNNHLIIKSSALLLNLQSIPHTGSWSYHTRINCTLWRSASKILSHTYPVNGAE